MLSMWVNGNTGVHTNQVVWVEDGKALSSRTAPANPYLPQAEYLAVIFADLFHSSENTLRDLFQISGKP